MEIIYKSNQETKQRKLWFGKTDALIIREAQALLTQGKTGCLKIEVQVLIFRGESGECFLETNINNRS